jgi:DNA processing protein
MEETQKIFLHALRSLPYMGDVTLRKILAAYNNQPQAAWESGTLPEELRLGPRMQNTFADRHNLFPNPAALYTSLGEQDIQLFTEDEDNYPELLLEIPDHPLILYVRGNYDFSSSAPCIAVVGSRKFTGYGKQACESLVRGLSQAGITIVSGLAFGIDKVAHQTTIACGGTTLGVLGSGIDNAGITPTTHQRLGIEVTQHGALVSEFPPGTIPGPGNFPMRNRIIAGLCFGTLVIEAAEKSGSLITAFLSLDYNREVFAVPGSIFSDLSRGTHMLLKKGAIPVTSAQDILALLPTPTTSQEQSPDTSHPSLPPLPEQELLVYKTLSHESLHIDALAKITKLPMNELTSLLMLLELKKYTKHTGGGHYLALPR